MEKIISEKGLVRRHGAIVLIEHWAIAISGLVLILTGLFELPIAKRYYITSVPGLQWSGDYIFSMKIHYLASVVFIAASLFHVIFHGFMGHRGILPKKGDVKESIAVIRSFFGKGVEPPFHKYLPEQRLAYAGIAVIIAGLIVSGLIKTYKNVYAPDMSLVLVLWATWVHNALFVLFILAFIAHMAAILIKPNRPMIRAMFTGTMRLVYAEHRHPLWIAGMKKGEDSSAVRPPAGEGQEAGVFNPALSDTVQAVEEDEFSPGGDVSARSDDDAVPEKDETH